MPQTNRAPIAGAAGPRQRSTSRPPSTRQLRERDWDTLVNTRRLLSRLAVERVKHRLPDDADTLMEQAVLIEEQLEHCYPIRWPRLHPRLLLEEAAWWAEDGHAEELLDCQACWYQGGVATDRIDVPRPRQVRTRS